ncbi:MAG: lysophospholipid acyltransferase family protein [Flavitalea sp.]
MYYLVYIPIYLISLLPLRVLYIIADGIYGLLYYLVGYRKKVVLSNLTIAFPHKTEAERIKIMKGFYKNFVDTFIETIKLLSAGKSFLEKHVEVKNVEILNGLYARKRRVQVHLGHNFNWEYANAAFAAQTPYTFLGVYMPIKNKNFDRMFRFLRSRFGTVLIPATDMRNSMLPYRHELYLLGLVADQVPGDVQRAYWLNFFGKPAPFARGPERGARAGDISVVFAKIYKLKRGKYVVEFSMGVEHPTKLEEGALTAKYVKFLEEVINLHPDMWLWSHRRWKREWKDEYEANWVDDRFPNPASGKSGDVKYP